MEAKRKKVNELSEELKQKESQLAKQKISADEARSLRTKKEEASWACKYKKNIFAHFERNISVHVI